MSKGPSFLFEIERSSRYRVVEIERVHCMYEIKSVRLCSQILTCFIFQVLFSKKNHCFIEKSNPSEKNVIVEEELDCIDIDDIGHLGDSPRLVYFDEECRNLIVVNDGAELTRNINQRKKSDVLQ